jgi:hypothetical protein
MSIYFKYSSSYQTSFHNLARFHICEDLLSIDITKRLKIFDYQTKLKHTNLIDLDLPRIAVNVEVVVDAPSPFVVEQVRRKGTRSDPDWAAHELGAAQVLGEVPKVGEARNLGAAAELGATGRVGTGAWGGTRCRVGAASKGRLGRRRRQGRA